MRSLQQASRSTRWAGRQLTRAGALSQRLRLLPAAEAGFRAALRLSEEAAWYVRLGRIQEARKRWGAAAATYRRCLTLIDRSPAEEHRRAGILHRLARAQARRKEWDAAEASFVAALALRPEIGTWHGHLAEVYTGREDWTAAAESYRRAAALEPDQPAWWLGAVRAYTSAGRPDLAAESGDGAPPECRSHPSLARPLAAAYQSVGDWRAAAALLRTLAARKPRDYALRNQFVDCLEMAFLVPFALDHRGRVELTAEEKKRYAEDALVEAVDQLDQLAAQEADKPGPAFRLAMVYERSGQLSKAASAYRTAMERLTHVDAWWCHRAAHEWAFRLSYVREQLETSESAGRRVQRTATPRRRADPVREPAGFFDAVIFRHGLQMSGFLLPGPHREVEIYVDDLLIKRVRVETSEWRPALRFDITHGLLNDFPERSSLSVRAGRQPLVTVDGADALEMRVPGGTGRLGAKLAKGLPITKKGSWPKSGSRLARRQGAYLRVYQRAKELLDQQGRPLFLSYGTLLGCHREGRFITGDDDFDVGYVSRAANPAQYRAECWRVAAELLREGLDIKLAINGRMLQAGLGGVWIDISPMWFYRDRIWSFDAHDLTPETFEPVRAGTFLETDVYLPRHPEAFLADAYGADWRTPQPQFRHYRSKADDRVLAQMWAKPSEVRRFLRLAEAERARNPAAGTFAGVGSPGYPGFSWLTSPAEPGPADL